MYQYEQFRPGDLIRSAWANKLENLGLRISKFYGVVQTASELPDPATLQEGHWQIVLEDLSLRIVKNLSWQFFVPRLNITLEGDVLGNQTQTGSDIVITTESRTKVTGAQLYGDVVGSGHVSDGVLLVSTQIPDKLTQIELTGAVTGTGTAEPDGTMTIPTRITGIEENERIVTTTTEVKRIEAGADSDKPEPGMAGRVYVQHDTQKIYYDTGSQWKVIGAQGESGAGSGNYIPAGETDSDVSFYRAALFPIDLRRIVFEYDEEDPNYLYVKEYDDSDNVVVRYTVHYNDDGTYDTIELFAPLHSSKKFVYKFIYENGVLIEIIKEQVEIFAS